jgi:hypothetical protein
MPLPNNAPTSPPRSPIHIGRKNLLSGILLISFLVGLATLQSRSFREFRQDAFNRFLPLEVRGQITKIRSNTHGYVVSVDSIKYYLEPFPIRWRMGDMSSFNPTAEVGDSLIKMPYADTLTIKKRNGNSFGFYYRDHLRD